MQCRGLVIAILAAACYSPSVQTGAPCGPGGECPSGQLCVAGVCGGTAPDDAPVRLDDAPFDTIADAPADGPPYIAWGTPLELTTLETPANNETDPSLTADKLTLVFNADTASSDSDIYIATRAALTDTFTFSLLTALNSTGFDDASPEISADGKTIYFTSARGGDNDVYISTFTTVWSVPVLATDLSSTSSDEDVAISPDGLTAVVEREGPPNRFYIYTRASTAAPFANPTVHTELNITNDIAGPTITNGGQVIYLHAGQPRDLYRATLTGNGTYTTPVPVTELSAAGIRDAAPFVIQTENYLVFERDGDIFETTR